MDVVQSIKTGPVETTGRGVAVIGITTRVVSLPRDYSAQLLMKSGHLALARKTSQVPLFAPHVACTVSIGRRRLGLEIPVAEDTGPVGCRPRTGREARGG